MEAKGALRYANQVRLAILLLLVGLTAAACRREPAAAVPTEVRVAAAADLSTAFLEVGRAFEAKHHLRVTFSFGSTGLLAKQLSSGAPFDVFAAASRGFVDEVLKNSDACDGASAQAYGRGRVALFVPKDSPAGAVPSVLEELREPRFAHVAIANPEHAPYGLAAKQALEHHDVWKSVEPRLVFAENVRQAMQLAESGNVEAAFVALSLVVNAPADTWLLVPESAHPAIEQVLVVCRHGPNAAGGEAFARFVNSDEGRAVMKRFGFMLPGENVGRLP